MTHRTGVDPRRRVSLRLLTITGVILILVALLPTSVRGQDEQGSLSQEEPYYIPDGQPDTTSVSSHSQGETESPEANGEDEGPTYVIDPTQQEGDDSAGSARKSRLSADLIELMNYTAAELSVAQADGTLPEAAPPVSDDRRVVVDIYVTSQDDVPEAITQLLALGFEITGEIGTVISGWIPIDSLPAVESIPEVMNCLASNRLSNAGKAMSEGDRAMGTDKLRQTLGLTGKGITIAVLSDSYNTLGGAAADIASGDLPSDIEVVADWTQGKLKDEGRAMLQLVHDCAPEAKLTFHHVWGGIAQFALAIQSVAGCPPGSSSSCKPAKRPANVIVDDVFYFGEPFFQDGLIAQAVDIVTKAGMVYVAAAGNYARQSWEGNAKLTGEKLARGRWTNFQGGYMHDFTGKGTYYQRIKVPASGQMWFTLQWQQPFASSGGKRSATDWDCYLFDDTNNDGVPDKIVKWATTVNTNGDAVEYLGYQSTYGSEHIYYLALVLNNGAQTTTERLKWINTGVGTPMDAITNSPTLFGHANADGSIAVAAASARQTPAYGINPANPEAFTALGTSRIYFDIAGNPVSVLRSHPDVTGPDGTLNTFFGGYTRFYGTSAAAPHVAAVAAVMLQAKPCLTPKQVRQLIRDTALDMKDPYNPSSTGYDWTTGEGFIDAVGAVNAAKSLLCSSCPLTFVWKNMPDAASVGEDLAVTVLVSCAGALGTGYSIAWSADLFGVTTAMGSNTGQLRIPKATLVSKAGQNLKLTAKITKGSTEVTESVTIRLSGVPALCSGCKQSALFKLTSATPLTFGGTFSIQTISSGAVNAAKFAIGTLAQGVFMPLTTKRTWASTTISDLPVPIPSAAYGNLTNNLKTVQGAAAIVIALYSTYDIPAYITAYVSVKSNPATSINTLAQNAMNKNYYVNAAQLLSLAKAQDLTTTRESALKYLLSLLRSGYDTDAIAHAAMQVVSASTVNPGVAGELFSLVAELDGYPLSLDAARDTIEALVEVIDAAKESGASNKFETEAVASYTIQTGLQYIDNVLKATLQNVAALTQSGMASVGLGVGCNNKAASVSNCRMYADVSLLRTDQVFQTSWWSGIDGLSMTAGKTLAGAGVGSATGLFVSYISWTSPNPFDNSRKDTGNLGVQGGMSKLMFNNVAMSGGRATASNMINVGGTGQPIVRMRVTTPYTTLVSKAGQYNCLNREITDSAWSIQAAFSSLTTDNGFPACQQSLVSGKYVSIGRKSSTTNLDEEGNEIPTGPKEGKAAVVGVVGGIIAMVAVGVVLIVGGLFLLHRYRRSHVACAVAGSATWPREVEKIEENTDLHTQWQKANLQSEPTSPASPASPPSTSTASILSPARQSPTLRH